MSQIYAEFRTINGHIVRMDTRVYLHDLNRRSNRTVSCIGLWYGKNPGSAGGDEAEWGPVNLRGATCFLLFETSSKNQRAIRTSLYPVIHISKS